MSRTVFERVVSVVCEELGVPASECKEETLIMDDLGADSLDLVEVVMGIEEEFGIDVEDDALPTTNVTIKAIMELVEFKLGKVG